MSNGYFIGALCLMEDDSLRTLVSAAPQCKEHVLVWIDISAQNIFGSVITFLQQHLTERERVQLNEAFLVFSKRVYDLQYIG